MFELICNVLLFVFLGYTYFTHVLEAKVPKSYLKNPNVLHPSVWPKVIIILLLICIAINIVKIIKKNKGNPEFTFKAFGKNSLEFIKSAAYDQRAIPAPGEALQAFCLSEYKDLRDYMFEQETLEKDYDDLA